MRLVIQRVNSSSVSVATSIIGQIDKGLCVLIGIGDGDTSKEIEWAKDQILKTKFWENENGKPWNKTVKDLNYKILLISQFTLYGKMYKKGKLDFHHAMSPAPALELYNEMITTITNDIGVANVQSGEFGAMMEVSSVSKMYESYCCNKILYSV